MTERTCDDVGFAGARSRAPTDAERGRPVAGTAKRPLRGR